MLRTLLLPFVVGNTPDEEGDLRDLAVHGDHLARSPETHRSSLMGLTHGGAHDASKLGESARCVSRVFRGKNVGLSLIKRRVASTQSSRNQRRRGRGRKTRGSADSTDRHSATFSYAKHNDETCEDTRATAPTHDAASGVASRAHAPPTE